MADSINTINVGGIDKEVEDTVARASGTSAASRCTALESSVSNLSARVEEIIAPTGEAPNPAEIVDARITVDNVTKPSLGDAIRDQIKDVKYGLIRTLYSLEDFIDISFDSSESTYTVNLNKAIMCSTDLITHVNVGTLVNSYGIPRVYTTQNNSAKYFVYNASTHSFRFVSYGKNKTDVTNKIDYNNEYAILFIYSGENIVVPMPGINLKVNNSAIFRAEDPFYLIRDDSKITKKKFNRVGIERRFKQILSPITDGFYDFGTAIAPYTGGPVPYRSLQNQQYPIIRNKKYITWEFDNVYDGVVSIFNPKGFSYTIFQGTERIIEGYYTFTYKEIELEENSHICVTMYSDNEYTYEQFSDFVSSFCVGIEPKENVTPNSSNLFNWRETLDGYQWNVNSNALYENYKCCAQEKLIPVTPRQKIYINNVWHACALLDYNGNPLPVTSYKIYHSDDYASADNKPVYEYTIPEGCYYIGVSALCGERDKLQVAYHYNDIKAEVKGICSVKNLYRLGKDADAVGRLYYSSATFNNQNCTWTLEPGNTLRAAGKLRYRCNDLLVGCELQFLANSDIYFGFDSTLTDTASNDIRQSALCHINTANKTVSFEAGNLYTFKNGTSSLAVVASVTYNHELNFDYKYLITVKKYSVCKYDIEFKCVNTGEVIALIEHEYSVDQSNPDSVTGQVRGWDNGQFYLKTGSVTIYNDYINYIGPLYPRVAVFGDSYIENYGKNYLAGWANRLYDALNGEVFIAGYGGSSMPGMLWRMPVEMNLCNPKYMVLATGVNDSYASSLDDYMEGIPKLIKYAESRGAEPILVTCPICEASGNSNAVNARTITDFVRNSGYKYIDYHAALCTEDDNTPDWNKYLADKVHPNIAGGAAIFAWIQANLPEICY